MAAIILDGRALAAKVKGEVKERVAALSRKPALAVVLVGDNPASRVYVSGKEKDCAECGIYSEEYTLPAAVSQQELLDLVDELNGRENVDGILVQLPLPEGLDSGEVIDRIDPGKDVDCFHPRNVGRLVIGEQGFQPCTPAGVMRMLDEYGISPAGKHCVVLGRSNIVGKPQALLLLQRDATVTICHSKTQDLKAQCLQADILISAVGRPHLITADMVKPGAAVIDVAMNRNEAGKLCGDVEFDAVKEVAAYLTPVPGGVGPMTRAMLMENVYRAAVLHGKK